MLECNPYLLRPTWFINRYYRTIYLIFSLLRFWSFASYDCDPTRVKVFLISRDLCSCLLALVERCVAAGVLYKNIFVIDQGSRSAECRRIYDACSANGVNVIPVKKDSESFGPYVVWLDASFAALRHSDSYPYIVSDTDLCFPDAFPDDWLEKMFQSLNDFKLAPKIALPLRVGDIDVENREEILRHESGLGRSITYWFLRLFMALPRTVRVCQTDTTFSLYRPEQDFSTISIRLDTTYELLHMPWYKSFVSTLEYRNYKKNKLSGFGMWS